MDKMQWRCKAACAGQDPELFFPVGVTGPAADRIERAKEICRGCPVLIHCLDWAMDTRQPAGIWGGLTEDERHSLRRARRRRCPGA